MDKAKERALLEQEMDNLVAIGRARMPENGHTLYPCEVDWLSPAELATLHELKMRFVALQDTTAEIRARVAEKRRRRLMVTR